jgi:hypothetical protein
MYAFTRERMQNLSIPFSEVLSLQLGGPKSFFKFDPVSGVDSAILTASGHGYFATGARVIYRVLDRFFPGPYQTRIRLQTARADLILGSEQPLSIAIARLAGVMVRVEGRYGTSLALQPASEGAVRRFAELLAQRDSGSLSEEEFQRAKSHLLSGL